MPTLESQGTGERLNGAEIMWTRRGHLGPSSQEGLRCQHEKLCGVLVARCRF